MSKLALLVMLLVPQTSRPKTATLTFEIITPTGMGSRVASQNWGRVFAKLGHIVTVRQQTKRDGDGPDEAVTQTETSSSRRIKAIGMLDKSGRVHFGSQSFGLTDESKLRDWITGLKKYGVQGDPKDQPMWGLNPEQFDTIFRAMAKPVDADVKGMSLPEAITAIKIPSDFPIKWEDGAKNIAAKGKKVDRDLRLFGRGTVLGVLLADAGLGFVPRRQPDGSIAVLITNRNKSDHWPVGWLPQLSIAKTLPSFYKRIDVSLPNVSLTRVFSAIESSQKLPILVDHHHIKAKGQEFDKMKVEIRPRKMSWNNVIRTATTKNRLSYEVRVDELGKPFVWVSTNERIKTWRGRFKK